GWGTPLAQKTPLRSGRPPPPTGISHRDGPARAVRRDGAPALRDPPERRGAPAGARRAPADPLDRAVAQPAPRRRLGPGRPPDHPVVGGHDAHADRLGRRGPPDL